MAAMLTLWGVSSRAAEQITLVAYGDSLVAGYGLPQDEGFVPQLEAWLHQNGAADVKVLNAGVSGETTSAGVARLDWAIGPEADAVLLELGANDALRGVDPSIPRENLDQMLQALTGRDLPVLLAGMYAPRNWGAEYQTAFDAIYPDLAAKYEVPLYPFFLDGLIGETGLFQSDGIHPNKQGVAKLVETIGPSVLELVNQAREAQKSE
ncbi:MAG: arylesterase [Rhodobacteraceae bacterium]|nr:arylesterase [Paracoccaceae bacterium]